MTPKEKAIDLFKSFYQIIFEMDMGKYLDQDTGRYSATKKAAVKAIEEIEQSLTQYGDGSYELQNMDSDFRYWEEVKQEINNL